MGSPDYKYTSERERQLYDDLAKLLRDAKFHSQERPMAGSEFDDCMREERAFVALTVTKAIRDTCDAARESKSTLDEVLAAFENLASTVERHQLGEAVTKAPYVHDDAPHGTYWATGEEEDR